MIRSRQRFLTRAMLAMALLLVTMVSLMMPVLADDTDNATAYNSYVTGNSKWDDCKEQVTAYIVAANPKILDKIPKSELCETNDSHTGTATTEQAKTNIPGASGTITDAGLSQLYTLCKSEADKAKAKSKVDSISGGFAMNPDIDAANAALSGLMQPISLAVGILCVIVMVAMTALTASDLIYITVPFFREKSDSAAQSSQGHGMMVNQSKRTGESKARWVTDEAYYAVRQSVEAGGSGRNPLWVYLWKRMGAFIALGIVMYILFTGNITLIVSFIINIISGFMGALGNLGT